MSGSKQNEFHNCRQALMGQILQYLVVHPNAKDTVDGVLKWWLPSDPIEWEKEEVQETLDHFVSKGWLAIRPFSLSRKLYYLKKEQLKEIKRFLQKFLLL